MLGVLLSNMVWLEGGSRDTEARGYSEYKVRNRALHHRSFDDLEQFTGSHGNMRFDAQVANIMF